jgi:hypothetical protein
VLVGVDVLTDSNQNWGAVFNDTINSAGELLTLPNNATTANSTDYARLTIAVFNTTTPVVSQRQAFARGVVITFLST